MRQKLDTDSTTARKALRLYQKLLLDGRRHYQSDLAAWLNCSVQTVMRLAAEIEGIVGEALATGLDKHRRWYQMRSVSRNKLGLNFEELRYLAICRDLAQPYLPEHVRKRVDESLFSFSMLMADQDYAARTNTQKEYFACCPKGWIDYTPYFGFLEKLTQAMEEKLVCIVIYKSPSRRKPAEHRIAVNRLVGMHNALYALGAILTEDFSEIRHLTNLAVHRMRDVILTDRNWNFDLPLENLHLFGLPWHEPRTFRIHIKTENASQYVRERVWSEKQKITPHPEGGIILQMVSCSEKEVTAWVRSFGDEAELLEEN